MSLTNSEREKLTQYLLAQAGDEVLLQAVKETVDSKEYTKSEYKRLSSQLGVKDSAHKSEAKTEVKSEPKPEEKPEGKEPPGTAASKIRQATQMAIEKVLKHERLSLRDVNASIGGKIDNTKALLKLLWKRGSVDFDGESYGLKE